MNEAARTEHRRSPLQLGIEAARRNALPGTGLALFAVTIGVGYAFVPQVNAAFSRIADWRQGLSEPLDWLFAVVSTAVFGGVIPWLVQRYRDGATLNDLAFWSVFWGYKGFEINLLYLVLNAVVGEGNDARVVLGKVALDMGFYCPIWAVPTTLLAYQFKEAGYRCRRVQNGPLRHGLRSWWRWDALPITINNWMVWIPAVAVIYTMPLPLQLPIQNLVLCFWSLALIVMTRSLARDPADS